MSWYRWALRRTASIQIANAAWLEECGERGETVCVLCDSQDWPFVWAALEPLTPLQSGTSAMEFDQTALPRHPQAWIHWYILDFGHTKESTISLPPTTWRCVCACQQQTLRVSGGKGHLGGKVSVLLSDLFDSSFKWEEVVKLREGLREQLALMYQPH